MALQKLLQIMSMLRDKQHGCPWDLEQTNASLVRYTLEEVYEVVDAIENGTSEQLKDELGDLLFQVVFYTQIAREENQFDFEDVVEAITEKLVRRHPHVFPLGKLENFGQDQDLNADDVVVNWEAIKEQERKQKGQLQSSRDGESVLSDIPIALPALERALKLQKRTASAGFDWDNILPVLEKLKEEVGEIEEAVAQGDSKAIADEIGDLLFATVNVARHLKVEPENALRQANQKFERRFGYIERQLKKEGKHPRDVNLEKLDEFWEQAKQEGL